MLTPTKIQKEKPIQELINFSIINLDKPSGPTSFNVDCIVKNALKLKKTSHFGTLDPMVSGVLPLGLGRACRLSDFFMHKNKTYVGVMRVHKEVSDEELEKAIKNFTGKIKQLPPVRSRVKREIREREVKSFDIIEREGKDILFKSEVQAGTYIRKLCDDVGKEIGGAHMLELRRTNAGIFSENDESFVTLYDFEKAVEEYKKGSDSSLRKILIPAEKALEKIMPIFQAKKGAIKKLLTGKPLTREDLSGNPIEEDIFSLFSGDSLVGIYQNVKEGNIIARPLFVYN